LISCRTLIPFPLAVLGLVPCMVLADDLDTLQFQAGQSVERDSNVFRLSDSANTQAVIGSPTRSDTIAVTTLGFKLNKPYGLQRFELDVNAQDYHYQRFSHLDFTALNYAAAWRWSFTPALHGNLTSDRKEYIDTAADVQNFGQVSHRTIRSTVFDAEYEIDGAWRLVGGVFDRSSKSSEASTFEADTEVEGAEAGVRYVFPSNTSMAYRFRNGDGNYPGRPLSPMFARSFRDREHEFRLDWAPTAKTMVRGRLSHFDRSHDDLAARDFSGVVGQVDATWAVTAKTAIAAGAARELGSYQTATASYFEGHRFFIAPTWKPTEKTALRARYSHGVRDYNGALPGFVESNRRDTTKQASLAFDWMPWRALKLTASLQRDRRTSSEPGFDYRSNTVGLSALASF
jgi:exopolysaccharide biosynthesis operon protein EpsL